MMVDFPLAAKQRAWIVEICHSDPMGHMNNPVVQDILSTWIARGTLSDKEWFILERLAGYSAQQRMSQDP